MFRDESIYDYYQTNFLLINKHEGFTLDMLERMMPFEREIYIALLMADLEKQKRENAYG